MLTVLTHLHDRIEKLESKVTELQNGGVQGPPGPKGDVGAITGGDAGDDDNVGDATSGSSPKGRLHFAQYVYLALFLVPQ